MQIKAATILAVSLFTAFVSACGGGGGDAPAPESVPPIERVVNMPAGFQVIGDHGVVQVDENFINMGLTARGQVSMPSSGSPAPTATITATGDSPILCIRPLSTYAAILSVSKSGNQYTWTLVGGFNSSATPQAETFDWYVFDKMQPGSAGNVGLEVRDANGVTTFNSNFAPMIVSAIGVIPNTILTQNPATVDTGIPGTYAACLSEGRLVMASNGYVSRLYVETIRVTSTGATTFYEPYGLYPPDFQFNSGGGGQILLVDVAGL